MTDAGSMWDQRFGADAYLYGTEPNDFLRASIDRIPMGDVLCLADGEGRNGVFLSGAGRQVTSVDLSHAGLDKTRRLAAQRGVSITTVHADLAEFDLGVGRWDAIVSIFAHTPPSVRVPLHRSVVEALRPGGVLVLEAYTPDQIGRGTGGPPVAEMTMTLDALRVELDGLVFDHAAELVRDVVEGPGHTGPGAVVQVIAHHP